MGLDQWLPTAVLAKQNKPTQNHLGFFQAGKGFARPWHGKMTPSLLICSSTQHSAGLVINTQLPSTVIVLEEEVKAQGRGAAEADAWRTPDVTLPLPQRPRWRSQWLSPVVAEKTDGGCCTCM